MRARRIDTDKDRPQAAPAAEQVLEVRGLSFRHDATRYQLRDLSVAIRAGEVCCLLGPNGTGKTTLMRCILGLLRPTAGEVLIGGSPAGQLSDRELARRVAYVPQQSSSPFQFTALDIAVMGRTPYLPLTAVPGRADREAARAALEQVGIAHLADRSFTSLSGGERQLALFARALVQQADLLVLDEPTAALDYGNAARILSLVTDLGRSGRTVLMSSHHPDHALGYADRAILLRDGRLLADGPPAEVVTGPRLTDLYGVTVHVVPTPLRDAAGRELLTCLTSPDSGSRPEPVATERQS